eukprot:4205692-Ditylum_brightwellii.AAC.1
MWPSFMWKRPWWVDYLLDEIDEVYDEITSDNPPAIFVDALSETLQWKSDIECYLLSWLVNPCNKHFWLSAPPICPHKQY